MPPGVQHAPGSTESRKPNGREELPWRPATWSIKDLDLPINWRAAAAGARGKAPISRARGRAPTTFAPTTAEYHTACHLPPSTEPAAADHQTSRCLLGLGQEGMGRGGGSVEDGNDERPGNRRGGRRAVAGGQALRRKM
jgi:hypothetical protein